MQSHRRNIKINYKEDGKYTMSITVYHIIDIIQMLFSIHEVTLMISLDRGINGSESSDIVLIVDPKKMFVVDIIKVVVEDLGHIIEVT